MRACVAASARSSLFTLGSVVSSGSATALPRSNVDERGDDGRCGRVAVEPAGPSCPRRPGCRGPGARPWRRRPCDRPDSRSGRACSGLQRRRTLAGGETSTPKNRTRRRLKPRSGPKPPPSAAAVATAARQFGSIPSWEAVSANGCPSAVNVTGVLFSAAARDESRRTACASDIPPTSTPAIVVPAASLLCDPAKARPRSTASTPRTTARKTARRRAIRRGDWRTRGR